MGQLISTRSVTIYLIYSFFSLSFSFLFLSFISSPSPPGNAPYNESEITSHWRSTGVGKFGKIDDFFIFFFLPNLVVLSEEARSFEILCEGNLRIVVQQRVLRTVKGLKRSWTISRVRNVFPDWNIYIYLFSLELKRF